MEHVVSYILYNSLENPNTFFEKFTTTFYSVFTSIILNIFLSLSNIGNIGCSFVNVTFVITLSDVNQLYDIKISNF